MVTAKFTKNLQFRHSAQKSAFSGKKFVENDEGFLLDNFSKM